MPHYQSPHPQRTTRSATPPAYPYSQYPGLAPLEGAAEEVLQAEASSLVPYSPQAGGALAPLGGGAADAATKSGGLLGSLGNLGNLGDIKGIIDRMGGLDGILETVGKVQKMMQTVQQFAPMAKMFTAFLPGAAAKLQAGATAADKVSYYKPPRRRRNGRRTNKRSGSGSGSRRKNVKRRR
ncbi:hypothetical protein [Paenibacillus antibioticophila]|uniref:hypothetical protein n=1 Tax=Paenibacillus antibioticophila TaxID=1274374 RepID=UPI0005CB53F6|nr:hypothetical protein [Paenibacillus antibioticophila]